MNNLIKDFLNFIRIEKGYSKHTIDSYKRILGNFRLFLEKNKIKSFPDVETTTLYAFLATLQIKGLSASSQEISLCALRSFFKFLVKEDIIETNVSKFIPMPKKWRKIPTILTIAEMESILALPNVKTLYGKRDRALLELLYGSGLRVSEAVNLKVKDLHEDVVTVFGKGNQERKVPVTGHFLNSVEVYWEARGNVTKEDYAFETRNKKPVDRIAIWKTVKKYSELSGINKNIHPHTFRHCFAVHMLQGKAEIRIIQELLGHSDIGITGEYLHLCLDEIADSFRKHHSRYDQFDLDLYSLIEAVM